MEETDEEWVADYLRLEYGEDIQDPDSVKASDIKHIGEFVINGVVTDYFSYPHSGEPSWAIIETIDDKDCVSITSNPPPEHSA
ncbi:hypothetical protein HBA55_17870 [Pseudomaricurvus alkylphenolicus]|uniref:hypothetical protein n=1 Tax=Pseudomaricurvus alkylphenolicus TaxID=1306991 RepID=UPI0014206D06|nr:hypothetical protein [Pseudomaricurvus alkylphenolicus]NIB41475.1 hypothetical protein [Pseudomaricurvus alkylphenolicus]